MTRRRTAEEMLEAATGGSSWQSYARGELPEVRFTPGVPLGSGTPRPPRGGTVPAPTPKMIAGESLSPPPLVSADTAMPLAPLPPPPLVSADTGAPIFGRAAADPGFLPVPPLPKQPIRMDPLEVKGRVARTNVAGTMIFLLGGILAFSLG